MSETQKKSDFPAVGWDDLIRKTNGRLEHLGLTLGVTKEVVTALVETVVDELGNDQRVRLKGLGTFTPRQYGGHTMNTPNVGEEGRVIKKQRVIRFNQSRIASQAINAKPQPGEKKTKKAKAEKKGAAKAEATEEPVKKAKKAIETEAVPEKKAKAVKAESAPSEEPKKAKKAKPEAEEAPKKAKKAKPVDEDEDEDEE